MIISSRAHISWIYSYSHPHTSAAAKGSTKTPYRRVTTLHHASQLKSAFPIFTQQQFSAVSTGLLLLCEWQVIWPCCLFDWEIYRTVPCNNSSVYEIYKIKCNTIKQNLLYGALHCDLRNLTQWTSIVHQETYRDNGCFKYKNGNISLHVFCGCETRSLTLRKKYRLKGVWEVVGPKRDEGPGDWRKLCKIRSRAICNLHQAIVRW
jgi:hypothetical protein